MQELWTTEHFGWVFQHLGKPFPLLLLPFHDAADTQKHSLDTQDIQRTTHTTLRLKTEFNREYLETTVNSILPFRANCISKSKIRVFFQGSLEEENKYGTQVDHHLQKSRWEKGLLLHGSYNKPWNKTMEKYLDDRDWWRMQKPWK